MSNLALSLFRVILPNGRFQDVAFVVHEDEMPNQMEENQNDAVSENDEEHQQSHKPVVLHLGAGNRSWRSDYCFQSDIISHSPHDSNVEDDVENGIEYALAALSLSDIAQVRNGDENGPENDQTQLCADEWAVLRRPNCSLLSPPLNLTTYAMGSRNTASPNINGFSPFIAAGQSCQWLIRSLTQRRHSWRTYMLTCLRFIILTSSILTLVGTILTAIFLVEIPHNSQIPQAIQPPQYRLTILPVIDKMAEIMWQHLPPLYKGLKPLIYQMTPDIWVTISEIWADASKFIDRMDVPPPCGVINEKDTGETGGEATGLCCAGLAFNKSLFLLGEDLFGLHSTWTTNWEHMAWTLLQWDSDIVPWREFQHLSTFSSKSPSAVFPPIPTQSKREQAPDNREAANTIFNEKILPRNEWFMQRWMGPFNPLICEHLVKRARYARASSRRSKWILEQLLLAGGSVLDFDPPIHSLQDLEAQLKVFKETGRTAGRRDDRDTWAGPKRENTLMLAMQHTYAIENATSEIYAGFSTVCESMRILQANGWKSAVTSNNDYGTEAEEEEDDDDDDGGRTAEPEGQGNTQDNFDTASTDPNSDSTPGVELWFSFPPKHELMKLFPRTFRFMNALELPHAKLWLVRDGTPVLHYKETIEYRPEDDLALVMAIANRASEDDG
ncbi:hypothetical protein HD806DRAFT_550070 [Xylariaceae sp. AK1471]|nr:hypothetical protein HD806DRAFT_550070 [Xylariaceae sp. AK1471]